MLPILLVLSRGASDTEEFGRFLRQARQHAGLRVNQVASTVGVTPTYVRMLERGERVPSVDTAQDLLSELGATVDRDPVPVHGSKPDLVLMHPGLDRVYALELKRRGRTELPEEVSALRHVREQLEETLAQLHQPLAGRDAGKAWMSGYNAAAPASRERNREDSSARSADRAEADFGRVVRRLASDPVALAAVDRLLAQLPSGGSSRRHASKRDASPKLQPSK